MTDELTKRSIFKPEPGSQLSPSIERAIKIAGGLGESIVLDFNGSEVDVNLGDDLDTVYHRWMGERQ
jgi:hypothetical protein